jgi:hypothetical protein
MAGRFLSGGPVRSANFCFWQIADTLGGARRTVLPSGVKQTMSGTVKPVLIYEYTP